jgi:hypothetical protein
MTTYKIIGGDGKEYGPIDSLQIRRWIAEGRLNPASMVLAEGATEWKPLSSFPEFANDLGAAPQAPPLPQTMDTTSWQNQVPDRDFDISITNCISRAWNLVTGNFAIIVGGVVIYALIQIGISFIEQIPFLGIAISLGNFVFLAGPFQAGLYYFLLKIIRGQNAGIGDIFSGFSRNYWQIVLGYIVMVLLIIVVAIPGGLVMAVSIVPMVAHKAAFPVGLAGAIVGFLLVLIPLIYLSVCWAFALPLIIDRQIQFWPALELSRKTVSGHWWMIFALFIVCGLVNVLGLLACCVGLVVSIPVSLGALMYAYEDIFSRRTA